MARKITVVLIFILLISIFLQSAAMAEEAVLTVKDMPVSGSIMPDDKYELLSENPSYALYVNMKTGDFGLYDKAAKYVWYSGQWDVLNKEHPASAATSGRAKTDLVSLIAVSYVQVSTIASTAVPTVQNSYAYSVVKGGCKTENIENGYRVSFTFADIGATVPVEIFLTKNGINAKVLASKIKLDKDYWITSIDLFPGFMAADERIKGYLFVPSGSGALVDIGAGKGDISYYEEMIYGEDGAIKQEEYKGKSKPIIMPVVGMKAGNNAVTAIITKGDESTKICAESNGSANGYSRVYTRYTTAIVDSTSLFEADYFNKRTIYSIEQRDYLDYEVQFTFSRNEKANYTGMAEIYRDYLISHGKLTGKASEPSLNVALYGAATKKASFLGIPYTKTFALTTFSEAENILKDLTSSGINVTFQYLGWNNGGLENKKVTVKESPVSVLGGSKGYKNLLNFLSKNKLIKPYFETDFISIRKSGNSFSTLSDTVRTMFNTRTPKYHYMLSVYVPVQTQNPWYFLKPAKMKKAAEKFASSYRGTAGVFLTGVGDSLYSDFSKKGTSRFETSGYYEAVAKLFQDKGASVYYGNAYTYSYAGRIFAFPETNDGNLIFSQSIPFAQIVLHGFINYSSEDINRAEDPRDALLKCVETGSEPYFCGMSLSGEKLLETSFNNLYSSSYSLWSKNAKSMYSEYEKIYKSLFNKKIIDHQNVGNISKTSFEDGTVIYVNYNNTKAFFDGIELPPKQYTVIGGGGS